MGGTTPYYIHVHVPKSPSKTALAKCWSWWHHMDGSWPKSVEIHYTICYFIIIFIIIIIRFLFNSSCLTFRVSQSLTLYLIYLQAEELRSERYELRVSLFDNNLHRFFGRTWKSKPHQATKRNQEQPCKVHFNEVGDLSYLQVVGL